MNSTRRSRERAQRKSTIVDAAEALFLDRGYPSTTMDEVAARAEVSKGCVYLYFESKDALLSAIAERTIAAVLELVSTRVAREPTGLARFEALLEAYSDYFNNNADRVRLALRWLTHSESMDISTESFRAYRDRINSIVGLAVGILEEGQRDGSIRPDLEPMTCALQTWGSFLGVWLLSQSQTALAERISAQVAVDELLPAMRRTAVASVRAPEQDAHQPPVRSAIK